MYTYIAGYNNNRYMYEVIERWAIKCHFLNSETVSHVHIRSRSSFETFIYGIVV